MNLISVVLFDRVSGANPQTSESPAANLLRGTGHHDGR